MKKLCFLLAILILLTGCTGQELSDPNAPCKTHTDTNNDGLCDRCQEVVVVSFDIYTINDLHGKFADADTHPGVDELSTYFRQAQASTDNVILLCSGDAWQGSSESNLTGGRILTDWMNEMGFSAMTLGNHEYDWGEDAIRANEEIAQFPFLGINIYSRKTNERVEYCDSSVIVDFGGIQVGIIGAMGDCYNSIASQNTTDIYFLTGKDLTKLVMDEATRLRSQGADFIIYSIHDGFGESKSGISATEVERWDISSYYDVELSNGYVDLVFEAHTHQRYILVDEYGVYHLQGGGDNKGVSYASVIVNTANGSSTVMQKEILATGEYALLEDDPIVENLLAKYDDVIAPANRVVGFNARELNKNEVRQLVADLYCKVGLERWGDEYDIVLGGGFISCRDPGYLAKGEVTYGMLQGLLPFDNELTLCSIRGRDLIDKFLETDHYSYFIKCSDYGNSIRNSIDPNATYYVVTDTFSAYYAPNRMTVVAKYDPEVYARDLVADYMGEGGLE